MLNRNAFLWFRIGNQPTICGIPFASMSLLQPILLTRCGNTKLPMIPPMNVIDITLVASWRDNGPLGNTVFGFCSSKKLAEAQPTVDPYDAVSRFPENHRDSIFAIVILDKLVIRECKFDALHSRSHLHLHSKLDFTCESNQFWYEHRTLNDLSSFIIIVHFKRIIIFVGTNVFSYINWVV